MFIHNAKMKAGVACELFSFFWTNKHWWLVPIIVALFLQELREPHGRRTMKLEWANSLLEKTRDAGLPFFFKQTTNARAGQGEDALGQIIQEFPAPTNGGHWKSVAIEAA